MVTCGPMAWRTGGVRGSGGVWGPFVAAALLALALASCDGNHVITPSATGVVWTRLTPTSLNECLWPDVRFDSLCYSSVQLVPIGGGNFSFQGRIIVSGVDGLNPVSIGYPGSAPWNDLRPRWTGSQDIVFMDNRGGTYDIWTKDLNTFDEHRITNFATQETAPAPRPGTGGLVYVELKSGATSPYDYGRLVLIPDTAAVPLRFIYLTPDTMECGDPDWDPTGTKLCFAAINKTDFTRHLYTMSLTPGDSLPIQITVGSSHDYQPRWSPDGGRIVFASDRTGRWGIWVVHPQGEAKGLILVAFDDVDGSSFAPTWTPDGLSLIVSSDGRGGIRSLWQLSNLPAFPF
jgi:WD40-like Beta Propeller Repeat